MTKPITVSGAEGDDLNSFTKNVWSGAPLRNHGNEPGIEIPKNRGMADEDRFWPLSSAFRAASLSIGHGSLRCARRRLTRGIMFILALPSGLTSGEFRWVCLFSPGDYSGLVVARLLGDRLRLRAQN